MTPSRSRFLNLDTTDISNGIILFFFKFYIKKLFIFGCLGSLLPGPDFSLAVVRGAALRCGVQASYPLVTEHGQTQKSGPTGWVAPWHVGSSWTRDRTCVPGIGRQVRNHWTTRKALG